MNILIAEPMAAAGIELFKSQAGWNVIVSNPKEYSKHLADADALVVRSAVQVTPAVLAQAPKLRVSSDCAGCHREAWTTLTFRLPLRPASW